MDRLRERVCLITGSTGIAAASAPRLAAEGASVFIVSRTAEHAQSLAAELLADVHGRPIEATESRYPADRYALDVRVDVEAPGPAAARAGG